MSAVAAPNAIEAAPTGGWELVVDLASRSLFVDGEPFDCDLSSKEFDLLCMLAGDPMRVFTKEEILLRLWGHSFRTGGDGKSHGGSKFSTRTLDSHACRLRGKLPPGFIDNVWGVGYRMIPPAATNLTVDVRDGVGPEADLHFRAERLARRLLDLTTEAQSLGAALERQEGGVAAILAYGIAKQLGALTERAGVLEERVV